MYKIHYNQDKSYEYVIIEDYVEPSREELIFYLECMYATLTECMLHPRTLPLPNKVSDVCKDWIEKINNSNITSEVIRHYQNPRFHKIPDEAVKKMKEFKKKYHVNI